MPSLHLVLEGGEHLEEDCPEGDEGGEEDEEAVAAEQGGHVIHELRVVLLLGRLQPGGVAGLRPPAATPALHTCGQITALTALHCTRQQCTVLHSLHCTHCARRQCTVQGLIAQNNGCSGLLSTVQCHDL